MIHLHVTTKFNRIPQIQASVRPALSGVVRKFAFDVKANVQTEMRAPKSGRVYRRGSRSHQASAPGEAPAVDLGQYINSIQVEHTSELTSTVGTNVKQAMALEHGSRKIAARPVWRPVIEKLRKPFTEAVTFVLRQFR